ncbi:MAG: hypothetical protein J6Y74_04960 [Clostridia bacterium]|nr:hypothetical protein [Clostridia bacterium]
MIKKIALILLLLGAIALLFGGCAKAFTFTYYIDDADAVHREYRLEYDAEAEDAEIVKQEAIRCLKAFSEEQGWTSYAELKADTAGVVELCVVFPSVAEYYAALGYTGKEPNEAQEKAAKGVLYVYDNVSPNYYSEETMAYARALLGEGYEETDLSGCELYYVYGTRFVSTKSNADSVEAGEDGLYYHTWKLEAGEEKDLEIKQYGLNGVLLYSVIISLFVLSLITVFVIIYWTEKKNKKIIASFGEGSEDAPKEKEGV